MAHRFKRLWPFETSRGWPSPRPDPYHHSGDVGVAVQDRLQFGGQLIELVEERRIVLDVQLPRARVHKHGVGADRLRLVGCPKQLATQSMLPSRPWAKA